MLSDIPLLWRILCTYLVLGALFALPTPLRGLQSPPDSTELHDRARRAQRNFEATHRTLLPMGVGQTEDRCEEHVGRLCLYGSDLGWEPAEDGPSHDGPYFRAVDLDLPPLKAGGYVLRLEMELPYRNQVVSSQRITVI